MDVPKQEKTPNAEDMCKMYKMCKMCTAKRPGETCQPNFTVLLNFD